MYVRFLNLMLILVMGVSISAEAPIVYAQANSLQPSAVDARIEIVWPHDQQGQYTDVDMAPLANIEVDLFERGTLNPVPCGFAPQVKLHWAQNWTSHVGQTSSGGLYPTDDAHPDQSPATEAVGVQSTRTIDGKTFPVWIFNDVPVQPYSVAGGTVTTFFLVEVVNTDYRTTVWSHGGNPLAYVPNPTPPAKTATTPLDSVDGLVQIVWPHDATGQQQSVTHAPLVNMGVDLAQHPFPIGNPYWTSVAPAFQHSVSILRALNNGYLEPVKVADGVISITQTYQLQTGPTSVTWPRWIFNNVDVSAAQDPANKYYFAVQVDGVATHTTIWAHGADPRTFFPQPDIPAASGANCE